MPDWCGEQSLANREEVTVFYPLPAVPHVLAAGLFSPFFNHKFIFRLVACQYCKGRVLDRVFFSCLLGRDVPRKQRCVPAEIDSHGVCIEFHLLTCSVFELATPFALMIAPSHLCRWVVGFVLERIALEAKQNRHHATQ